MIVRGIYKLGKGEFLFGLNLNFNELFAEQIDLDYYKPYKEKCLLVYLGKWTCYIGYKNFTK